MRRTIHQSRFWVYSTAAILSFNGGYINVVCLMSLLKNAVGYVTGNLTLAGEFMVKGQYALGIDLFVLVLCFLLGSIMSGLLINSENFKINYRYDLSLILQLCFVSIALFLLWLGYRQAGYLLALAMGLQNAMTTHYGSALIRTTHMTGTTTDLGLLISRWLKGQTIEYWKMRLYLCLILGFASGALAGAWAYTQLTAAALFGVLAIYLMLIFLNRRSPP